MSVRNKCLSLPVRLDLRRHSVVVDRRLQPQSCILLAVGLKPRTMSAQCRSGFGRPPSTVSWTQSGSNGQSSQGRQVC